MEAWLGLAGTLMVGSLVLPAVLLGRGWHPVAAWTVWYGAAFGAYGALLYRLSGTSPLRGARLAPRLVAVTVTVAVALRVGMLLYPPMLSDDVYRYVWDARVAAAGFNPYQYAPAAPELAGLRDALWLGLNAKNDVSPYPPLAQYWFQLVYRVAGESIEAHRIAGTLGDGVIGGLLLLILLRTDGDWRVLLAYLWSPLGVVQFAQSGHVDWLAVVGVCLGWFGALQARGWVAGLGVVLAGGVKLVPASIAPSVLGLRGAGPWLLSVAALGGTALPLLPGATGLVVGLERSGAQSVFNDSAHWALARVLAAAGVAGADAAAAAVGLAGAAIVALAIGVQVHRGRVDVTRGIALTLGAALLLSATVEPWYVTWALPPLAILYWGSTGAERLLVASGLLFTGTVQLTELTYLDPQLWPVVRLVEYGPVVAALGYWTAIWVSSRGQRAKP